MLANTLTVLLLIAALALCWAFIVVRRKRIQRQEDLRREDEARCSKPIPMKRTSAFSEEEMVKPLGSDVDEPSPPPSPSIVESLPAEVLKPVEAPPPPPEEKGYVWE